MLFLKKNTKSSRQISAVYFLATLLLLLSGCSKHVEKSEDIRPVRAIQLVAGSAELETEFSGEIKPRIESHLSFRVPGKIISRKVDAGMQVRRGQVLMQLDPLDLQLAQAQANAGLKAAETNRDLAKAEYQRYQDLREKNFVSQAVLDTKISAFKAAQAGLDQASAAYKGQSNQAGYASLVSDVDGVVTSVDAEIGQVVVPGTPVVRVAASGEKEVVIGLPEDKVEILRRMDDVQVRLWAGPQIAFPGKIREISPMADPATRTYLTRVSIPNAPAEVKLGMTAYVQFRSKTPATSIRVPLTALFQEKGVTAVWIIEKGVVKLVPVTIGAASANDFFITAGVSAGQMVATAGVNQLKPGQKVKILGDEPLQKNAVDIAANASPVLKPGMEQTMITNLSAGVAK